MCLQIAVPTGKDKGYEIKSFYPLSKIQKWAKILLKNHKISIHILIPYMLILILDTSLNNLYAFRNSL